MNALLWAACGGFVLTLAASFGISAITASNAEARQEQDVPRVEVQVLPDGTRCAVLYESKFTTRTSAISCDWQPQRPPRVEPLT